MRFLELTILLTLFSCTLSQNPNSFDHDGWLNNVVKDELQRRYQNSTDKEGWIRYIEGCFHQNDVYNKISETDPRIFAVIKRKVNEQAGKCELAGRFYSSFKSNLIAKFLDRQGDVEEYWEKLRRESVFEKSCFENCDYEWFLNQYIEEYSHKIEQKIQSANISYSTRASSQPSRSENDQRIMYYPTASFDPSANINRMQFNANEREKEQAKEKFYADLSQKLTQWYPQKTNFQEKLKAVSLSNKLNEHPGAQGMILNRNVFEDHVSKFLETSENWVYFWNYMKLRIKFFLSRDPDSRGLEEKIIAKMDIKVEMTFLEENALEKQIKPAVDEAKVAVTQDFLGVLKKNLPLWYRYSQYYWQLVNDFNLAWPLLKMRSDLEMNQQSFEHSMITLLNFEYRRLRENAMERRVNIILAEEYKGFEKYHAKVLSNMNIEQFDAEIIFNDLKIANSVRNTVQKSFIRELSKNFESWYPKNSNEFNKKLYNITKTEEYHLKDDSGSILSNKKEFEDNILPILESSEFDEDIIKEIKRRIKSMLTARNADLSKSDYDVKVIGKFLRAVTPRARARKLFQNKDFDDAVMQAIHDARVEIEDNAFLKLETNLYTWLPMSQDFVSKFISFIRNNKPSLEKMEEFDNADLVLSGANFEAFSVNENELFKKAVENETLEALKEINPSRTRRNFEFLQIQNPEIMQNLVPADKLKTRLSRIFAKVESCLNSFNETVDSHVSEGNDPELNKFLKSNICIRDEICIETTRMRDQPNDSLNAYISAFESSRHDSQARNTNIKDEIDETIYDVIETLVEENQKAGKEAAECFVKYLRRNKLIDPIYSSSLLFDEEELKKKIKSYQKDYENKFKRFLQK